ncbi:hypothetical protein B0H19DRAFT_1261367 [Mycena capillaripes]|nr:hypothetical protein B0H19DRAFT_1261367 [Mycena capillaripes]
MGYRRSKHCGGTGSKMRRTDTIWHNISAKAKKKQGAKVPGTTVDAVANQDDTAEDSAMDTDPDADQGLEDLHSGEGDNMSHGESGSEPEVENYRPETSRGFRMRMIHGIPDAGEDTEWDEFIADSDTDESEEEDEDVIASDSKDDGEGK